MFAHFSVGFDVVCNLLDVPGYVSTSIGDFVVVDRDYHTYLFLL